MHSAQRRNNGATRFALVLVLVSALALPLPFAFGASQEKGYKKEFVRFTCKDETVQVVPIDGTRPKAIYLCAGNTVTWDANGHEFIVIFKKSPFVDGKKMFNNKDNKSKAAKKETVLTVYNYQIIVDGQLVEDPQVVGGGE
jgi:plastocyanin